MKAPFEMAEALRSSSPPTVDELCAWLDAAQERMNDIRDEVNVGVEMHSTDCDDLCRRLRKIEELTP